MSASDQLHTALRREIAAITPDRVDDLLSRLGEQQPSETAAPVSRRAPSRARRMVAAVLALVLLTGGVFCGVLGAQRSVVTIDANAAVTFTVNGFDRVCSVRLEDARAAALVDPASCNGKPLRTAVENVTGQLIGGDCLTGMENAVLLTVQEDGSARAEKLAALTRETLDRAAADHSVTPAVLVQTLSETETAAPGATPGRTALVEMIVGAVSDENAAKLLDAPVQDLLFYADRLGIRLAGTDLVGTLNDAAYLTPDDAVQAARDFSGRMPDTFTSTAVLGWEDTELVYIVVLQNADTLAFYCVSARTGAVLDAYEPELEPQTETPEPVDESPTTPDVTTPSIPSVTLPTIPSIPSLPSEPSGGTTPNAVPTIDLYTFHRIIQFWDDII